MNLKAAILVMAVILLTSCVTSTEHFFSGAITVNGDRRLLANKPAPRSREESTPTWAQWRHVLREPDCVLVVRVPRVQGSADQGFVCPSNSFGVFVLLPSAQSATELSPPEPLHGCLHVDGRNGDTVSIEGASVDGRVEVEGRLLARRHLECRLVEGIAMMTGIGRMARVPKSRSHLINAAEG